MCPTETVILHCTMNGVQNKLLTKLSNDGTRPGAVEDSVRPNPTDVFRCKEAVGIFLADGFILMYGVRREVICEEMNQ